MRPLFLSCWGGLALLSGCALPSTDRTVGFDFHVGMPATVKVPATVQQTEGPLAVNGLAAMSGGTGQVRTALPFGSPGDCGPSGPVTAQLAPGPQACTLSDVCNSLNRIDMKLDRLSTERLPMPKGAP